MEVSASLLIFVYCSVLPHRPRSVRADFPTSVWVLDFSLWGPRAMVQQPRDVACFAFWCAEASFTILQEQSTAVVMLKECNCDALREFSILHLLFHTEKTHPMALFILFNLYGFFLHFHLPVRDVFNWECWELIVITLYIYFVGLWGGSFGFFAPVKISTHAGLRGAPSRSTHWTTGALRPTVLQDSGTIMWCTCRHIRTAAINTPAKKPQQLTWWSHYL